MYHDSKFKLLKHSYWKQIFLHTAFKKHLFSSSVNHYHVQSTENASNHHCVLTVWQCFISPCCVLYVMPRRRLWKSVQFDALDICKSHATRTLAVSAFRLVYSSVFYTLCLEKQTIFTGKNARMSPLQHTNSARAHKTEDKQPTCWQSTKHKGIKYLTA